MFAVCVHVHVRTGCAEAFIEETRRNASATAGEPGNLRFDILREIDDPDRFVLYEVYRDEAGMAAHKETAHYARWREAVEPMMASPRRGVKHESLFPEAPESWETRL